VSDLSNELLRMLKSPPSSFRHHPTIKTRLFMSFLLGLFILFGVTLRLLL
jgi:hypothetical protein